MQEYDPNKTSRIKNTVTSLRSDHIYMKGAVEDNNNANVFFFFKLHDYHLLHVAVCHEAVHGPPALSELNAGLARVEVEVLLKGSRDYLL